MSFDHDPSGNQNRGMHVCPQCDSSLVQPTSWEQGEDMYTWKIWLRCPECEWQDVDIFGKDQVDAYDVLLDEATAQLSRTVIELTRDNMANEADTLARAFEDDLITAEDFR